MQPLIHKIYHKPDVTYLTTLMLEKVFNKIMPKKYHYIRGERKAEREIDQFLKNVCATSTTSTLDELRLLSADA